MPIGLQHSEIRTGLRGSGMALYDEHLPVCPSRSALAFTIEVPY